MKKLLAVLALLGLFTLSGPQSAIAQSNTDSNKTAMSSDTTHNAGMSGQMSDSASTAAASTTMGDNADNGKKEAGNQTFTQAIKQTFIDGGPGFMSLVLITFLLGLAICIERIIYLNMASINKDKFLRKLEDALQSGGVQEAKELCRNTRGPIASIFYQGLERYDEGIDMVEKSVVSYGGVQMGLLEKGLSWISLFIALAPMLGFLGTVVGMIQAFNAIAVENNISPGVVASGIKVALITTVGGLIVAIILQLFYNYIVSKVDGIVNDMEDASISMVDILLRYNVKR